MVTHSHLWERCILGRSQIISQHVEHPFGWSVCSEMPRHPGELAGLQSMESDTRKELLRTAKGPSMSVYDGVCTNNLTNHISHDLIREMTEQLHFWAGKNRVSSTVLGNSKTHLSTLDRPVLVQEALEHARRYRLHIITKTCVGPGSDPSDAVSGLSSELGGTHARSPARCEENAGLWRIEHTVCY